MRRLLAASALGVLALATAASGQRANTATGQPPPPKTETPVPRKADVPANPPDRTEAAIAAALASDPDVKMARAKIQLAEAELAKARLAATLKVTALVAAIEQHKTLLDMAQKNFTTAEQRFRAGAGDQTSFIDARIALARAQAALAAAEAELKLITGGSAAPPGWTADPIALAWLTGQAAADSSDRRVLEVYRHARELGMEKPPTVKGPISDQLRAALDRPVKLAPKGEVVTFQQAMEVFKKEAGLDVIARGEPLVPRPRLDPNTRRELIDPKDGRIMMDKPEIISEGETLSVGAWLQVFQDAGGFTLYVREYGLLAANKQAAPPDAPTLTEFWKQKAPAPRPEPQPDQAPPPKSK